MAKLLQLFSNVLPEPVDGFILAFDQRLGFADIVGQTSLPVVDPIDIDAVIVADQDSLPVIDKLVKGKSLKILEQTRSLLVREIRFFHHLLSSILIVVFPSPDDIRQ